MDRGSILAPYREGLAGVDRAVAVMASCSFLFIAARLGALTFLGIWFVKERGITATDVGAALLVENLLRALAGPVAGAASDRFGRRPLIVIAGVASAAVMPAVLLVRDAPALFAWSAAIGLTQAPFFPSMTALLLDHAKPERRQSVLAVNYTALSVGYTLGVAPAGFLAERSFPTLIAASAGGFLLVAVVTLLFARDAPRAAGGPRPSIARNLAIAGRDRAFLVLAGLAFLLPLGLGLVSLAVPVYAADAGIPKPTIGLVLGLNGLVVALLAIPMNARLEAGGPFRHLPVAAALLAATWAALAASAHVGAVAGAVLLFSFAEIVFSAALPTAVASLAPPGVRGAYQGAWGMVFALSIGVGLFASGWGRDALGWRATWIAFTAATAIATIGLAVARPWFRRVADARARAG